jgi:cell division protease FtsH
MSPLMRSLLLWTLGACSALALLMLVIFGRSPSTISYSDFLNSANQGLVHDVVIQGPELRGHFVDETSFQTIVPNDPTLVQTLYQKKVAISARSGFAWSFAAWPLAMIAVGALSVWALGFVRQRVTNVASIAFNKAKMTHLDGAHGRVSFEDVGGATEAKETLQELVEFFRDPGHYQRLGAKIPKGVLLVGPPGTGKTLLARAVAGEANVPFLLGPRSTFVELFVGVGASRVRDIFEQAKKNAPCIIFIEEFDAIGRKRGTGSGPDAEEQEQALRQLLDELDGLEDTEGIVVLAATDRPDLLDPALTRKGRFDRRVALSIPDVRSREQILKVHVRKTPLAPDVNLKSIARATPGFTGADLSNVVNDAALCAARHKHRMITMLDFEDAVLSELARIITKNATWRQGVPDTPEFVARAARYTAGQVLVSRSLGLLAEDQLIIVGAPIDLLAGNITIATASKKQIESFITSALAGRAAEALDNDPGSITTLGAHDIKIATELAENYVKAWGLGTSLSVRTLVPGSEPQPTERYYAGELLRRVDREVSDLLERSLDNGKVILRG